MADPYITLAEVMDLVLGAGGHADEDVARLNGALLAACAAIDAWCGRTFTKAEEASGRRFRARPGVVWLNGSDIATADDLVVKTDQDLDGTYETTWTVDTDFLLEPFDQVRGGVTWPYEQITAVGSRVFPTIGLRPGVQITAVWGWPAVPEPVKQAARLLTVAGWKRKDAAFGVAGFDGFGAVRVREDPDVARLLAPFKRPGIA